MKQRTWLTLAAVAALAGAMLTGASTGRAEEYYVNADAASGGDGLTSATAFDSLDDITPFTSPALAAGDTIFVAGGTVNAYPAPVTAYSGVKLIGGVPPTGNPTQGFQNTGLYPTIIDASASNVGLFVADDATDQTLIDGFLIENAGVFGIQNGNNSQARFNSLILRGNGWHPLAAASGAFQNGGDYAFARVTNCTFEDNIGIAGGGAFRNPVNSSFLIERCTFSRNDALQGGAAIIVCLSINLF